MVIDKRLPFFILTWARTPVITFIIIIPDRVLEIRVAVIPAMMVETIVEIQLQQEVYYFPFYRKLLVMYQIWRYQNKCL